MDEPTIGLDPHQIHAMRELIDSLRGQISVILSSHILPEIEACCDKVIIINHGRVVAQGTTEELRQTYLPGKRFELVVSGQPGEFSQRLKSELGCDCEEVEVAPETTDGFSRFRIEASEGSALQGEKIAQLLLHLETCKTRELRAITPTLEEVFMQATRRSWEQRGMPSGMTQPLFTGEQKVEAALAKEANDSDA